ELANQMFSLSARICCFLDHDLASDQLSQCPIGLRPTSLQHLLQLSEFRLDPLSCRGLGWCRGRRPQTRLLLLQLTLLCFSQPESFVQFLEAAVTLFNGIDQSSNVLVACCQFLLDAAQFCRFILPATFPALACFLHHCFQPCRLREDAITDGSQQSLLGELS